MARIVDVLIAEIMLFLFVFCVPDQGSNESPIRIKPAVPCQNNVDHPFKLAFTSDTVILQDVPQQYHKKLNIIEGIGAYLEFLDTDGVQQKLKLTSVEIYSPARHRIIDPDKSTDSMKKQPQQPQQLQTTKLIPDIELVFYLTANYFTSHSTNAFNSPKTSITSSAVSFLFETSSNTSDDSLWHQESSFFLLPFLTGESTNTTLNLDTAFESFYTLKMNHGFYQYRGTKLAENCDDESFNWFVFDQILGVSEEINEYFLKSFGEANIIQGALREIQQFNHNIVIKVGCFPEFYEKMDLTLNKGFWMYIFIFLIYFLFSFKRPNPDNIFAVEFKDNLKTLIPWYSIIHLDHEKYFNKNSRSTLLLLQISSMLFIQSLFIGSLPKNLHPGVTLTIFSILSTFLSYPVCFILGRLNAKTYSQSKLILSSEIKIIQASEASSDEEEFIQQIERSQYSSHLYTHTFYAIAMFLEIFILICGSQITEKWQEKELVYVWMGSLPIMLGIDVLIDVMIVRSKKHKEFFASKGYYFDYSLAELIQENAKMKIV